MKVNISITGKTPYLGKTDYCVKIENVTKKSSITLHICTRTMLHEKDIVSLFKQYGVNLQDMTQTQWYDSKYWKDLVIYLHRTFKETREKYSAKHPEESYTFEKKDTTVDSDGRHIEVDYHYHNGHTECVRTILVDIPWNSHHGEDVLIHEQWVKKCSTIIDNLSRLLDKYQDEIVEVMGSPCCSVGARFACM